MTYHLESVSLYPYIENRQFSESTGLAVKTPLLVVYPTQTSGCRCIIGVGGLFIVDLGVWRCLYVDKPAMSYAFLILNDLTAELGDTGGNKKINYEQI